MAIHSKTQYRELFPANPE